MDFSNITIGYGITGSFCTFAKTKLAMEMLKDMGARLIPIYSYNAYNTDTRFTGAEEFRQEIMTITGEKAITTIVDALSLMIFCFIAINLLPALGHV